MLLGGGVGAIVPITYNSSRISFSFLAEPNQIFQLFLFMGKAQELFILKQVLNFSWSECSFVHFEFKGDVLLRTVLLLLKQSALFWLDRKK